MQLQQSQERAEKLAADNVEARRAYAQSSDDLSDLRSLSSTSMREVKMLREKKLVSARQLEDLETEVRDLTEEIHGLRRSACEAGRLLEAEQRKSASLNRRVRTAEDAANRARDEAEVLRRESIKQDHAIAETRRRADALQRALDGKEANPREVRAAHGTALREMNEELEAAARRMQRLEEKNTTLQN